jgi:cobalt/nickel transport system permease protein
VHIADGILPVSLCGAAWVGALAPVYWLGRRIDGVEMTRMGLLASAAFVASMVHFPLAGTSIHLGLFGLLGILLGKRAFPVVFVTLLFQALLFQHGGLLSLGLNTLNMGLGSLLGWWIWKAAPLPEAFRAYAAGFVGILAPAFLMAAEFSFAGYGKGFYYIAGIYTLAAAMEGVATMFMVGFFRRVKPELLPAT